MPQLTEGKVSHHLLKHLTELRGASHLSVIQYPEPGVDVATIDLGEIFRQTNLLYGTNSFPYLIYKSDPITFPTANPAYYLIIVNKNDLATAGASGFAMTVSILIPPGSEESLLLGIQTELDKEGKKEGISILGGHTEVTSSVNSVVLSGNMIGVVPPEYYIPRAPQLGDKIICSGWVGAEGTGILLSEGLKYFNSRLDPIEIENAKNIGNEIDISNRVIACNRRFHAGINMVHDATEGGILGALYECLENKGLGANIQEEALPIASVTQSMSTMLGIDPKKLISSGCVLFFCNPKFEKKILKFLYITGYPARTIGFLTEKDMGLIIDDISIAPPKADDLIMGLKQLSELND